MFGSFTKFFKSKSSATPANETQSINGTEPANETQSTNPTETANDTNQNI